MPRIWIREMKRWIGNADIGMSRIWIREMKRWIGNEVSAHIHIIYEINLLFFKSFQKTVSALIYLYIFIQGVIN